MKKKTNGEKTKYREMIAIYRSKKGKNDCM